MPLKILAVPVAVEAKLFLSKGPPLADEEYWVSVDTYDTSYQSLEEMHLFEAIFIIFGRADFEVIQVKGRSRLNFEAVTLKFFN